MFNLIENHKNCVHSVHFWQIRQASFKNIATALEMFTQFNQKHFDDMDNDNIMIHFDCH